MARDEQRLLLVPHVMMVFPNMRVAAHRAASRACFGNAFLPFMG
ncbi:hypothetical protein [Klebsiella quasipneumoniae]|jgi:hypothetical protein|nr:hypothetical protein [Klebsiella quasipneumoniae]